MKNVGILARLFGRAQQPAPVVSALYANAIGQPLLVHPAMGEQIIGGYLHGAVDARPPLLTIGELAAGTTDPLTGVVTAARSVAVLNISGALVNRFEGGMCEAGPVSYEEALAAYNQALNDPAIESIVLRLETPGGMASGLFDLADRIYETRGQKPVIAAIDDYAYSAGYGLAAACDQIWITRTGGAGSVGVIAYHYDQSGYDQKIGLKVTPVFSGAHKADMSPHAPLADDQRAWLQQRMDTMRQMFAESVAKYRGMTTDAVLATEAQVYQGAEAVAIGFADRIGTFAELMQSLASNDMDEDEEMQADAALTNALDKVEPAKTGLSVNIPIGFQDATPEYWRGIVAQMVEAKQFATDAIASLESDKSLMVDVAMDYQQSAIVTRAILAANLPPDLAVALMQPNAGVTAADVDARIAHASAIANICFAAGLPDVAADYVTANTPIDTARTQLIDLKASVKHELDTNSPPITSKSATPQPLSASAVYKERQNATENKQ